MRCHKIRIGMNPPRARGVREDYAGSQLRRKSSYSNGSVWTWCVTLGGEFYGS